MSDLTVIHVRANAAFPERLEIGFNRAPTEDERQSLTVLIDRWTGNPSGLLIGVDPGGPGGDRAAFVMDRRTREYLQAIVKGVETPLGELHRPTVERLAGAGLVSLEGTGDKILVKPTEAGKAEVG